MPSAVQLLIVLMGFDFMTGLISGFVRQKLSSDVGFRGIAKKLLALILLLLLHILEQAMGTPFQIEKIGALAFAINEIISIVENCAAAGVPIPVQVVEALLNAKKLRRLATKEQLAALGESEADGISSDRRER